MDAARSALRSGAASVTVAYRRTRSDMPAQVEEIEAAEREGVVVRTGLAPAEVVGRDGQVVGRSVAVRPADPAAGDQVPGPSGSAAPVDLPVRTILVAIGEEPDPSILPEGAGIEVSGVGRHRRRPPDPGDGRAGIFAGGDVVSGPKTIIDAVAAGRRAAGIASTSTSAGAPDGEAEILADGALPDGARARAQPRPATRRPRLHAPLPVDRQAGSFAATQAGFDAGRRPRRGGPVFPVRRGVRLPDRPRRRRPGSGRRPGRSRPETHPSARASRHVAGGAA